MRYNGANNTKKARKMPLTLPEAFDPEVNLVARTGGDRVYHESRQGARLARDLVANGEPEDLVLAEKVLDATLRCQELDPQDPHYGGFYWMAEDDVVGDLNAVEFNLEHLIPMMIEHADRLSPDMHYRVREAIRLGLDAIRKLDVLVAYSNITMLDILNSVLGGEYLEDAAIAERGYKKLVEWMAYTDRYGTVREFNSPTYLPVTIRALKQLTDFAQHEPTRVRARTFAARLGLSAALHIHSGTGRWAGPHARAYHPSVVCETPPEIDMVKGWTEDGHLPEWMADALEPTRFEVIETADSDYTLGLTTYHSPSFALGTATSEYTGQSDVLFAHYNRADRPGVMYCRYLMDDKWLGDFYHQTDRTKSRNLIDEGRFFGVQSGPRAIGLYRPRKMDIASSAKAAFVFTQIDHIDEIWAGDRRVEIDSLPADVPDETPVVIGSGGAWIAVRPLTRTLLGRPVPIQLVERRGDLVLEIPNYRGSRKPFWNMENLAFFQGQPQCGVYVEMAERGDYASGADFAAAINAGALTDEAAGPVPFYPGRERPWTVEYQRDGHTVGIEIDLMGWALKRRWNEYGDLGWPMLESPLVRQNRDGSVVVGEAALTCTRGNAAWLFGSGSRWAAGVNGASGPVRLTLPDGEVEIDSMSTGTIVWDNGTVTVDAVDLVGTPTVTGGTLAQ